MGPGAESAAPVTARVTLARPGDADSFEAFLVRESDALLRFAVRLTGDRGHAEELLQQVLVDVAVHWGRIRRRDDPAVYVRRSLVNGRSRAWRRRRREELWETPPDAPDPLAGGGPAAIDDRLSLRAALLALPPRQRAVLVLRYYEDRSEAEIAALLGCSRGTVKSQASKALASLRARAMPDDPAQGGEWP